MSRLARGVRYALFKNTRFYIAVVLITTRCRYEYTTTNNTSVYLLVLPIEMSLYMYDNNIKMRMENSTAAYSWGKENAMEEKEIFKGYLRGLMRQLKLLKKTIGNNDLEQAEQLVDELIEDTQNNIED